MIGWTTQPRRTPRCLTTSEICIDLQRPPRGGAPSLQPVSGLDANGQDQGQNREVRDQHRAIKLTGRLRLGGKGAKHRIVLLIDRRRSANTSGRHTKLMLKLQAPDGRQGVRQGHGKTRLYSRHCPGGHRHHHQGHRRPGLLQSSSSADELIRSMVSPEPGRCEGQPQGPEP